MQTTHSQDIALRPLPGGSPFGTRGNVLTSPPETVVRLPVVMHDGRFVTIADLCDLIDAAGPLTLWDLAAGLGVTVREAYVLVDWLEQRRELRRDEWDRLTLSGICRRRHSA